MGWGVLASVATVLVFQGGLSILAEVLHTLRIDEMKISDGALREGLLYDLLGRLQHEDARERTVNAMESRYQVDTEQGTRVSETALRLYGAVVDAWGFNRDRSAKMLEWASRLHEIGLDISHDGYQRHGAYIAEHQPRGIADDDGMRRAQIIQFVEEFLLVF